MHLLLQEQQVLHLHQQVQVQQLQVAGRPCRRSHEAEAVAGLASRQARAGHPGKQQQGLWCWCPQQQCRRSTRTCSSSSHPAAAARSPKPARPASRSCWWRCQPATRAAAASAGLRMALLRHPAAPAASAAAAATAACAAQARSSAAAAPSVQAAGPSPSCCTAPAAAAAAPQAAARASASA